MKNRFEDFLQLHNGSEPLLMGNSWNVQSAKVFEKADFKAIATSSASVAESLGYEDGEEMSFEEYMFVVRLITKSVKAPVSIDIESGYADSAAEIASNIKMLFDAGVSGINLEDSVIENGKRSIVDPKVFSGKIKEIVKLLDAQGVKMFLNIRADSFLLGLPNALEDALVRIDLYQETGAHGLFFPCITAIEDIQKICKQSRLPINVMCMPGLPDFNELRKVGVRRISMGPFMNKHLYQQLESSIQRVVKDKSFKSLF